MSNSRIEQNMIVIMPDQSRLVSNWDMSKQDHFSFRTIVEDPYRLFFPLGTLFAIWGVLIWIFFHLGLIVDYPGPLHAHVMIVGFIFSFAAGFLMTAIPKFTSTPPARLGEVLLVLIPIVLIPLTRFLCKDVRIAFGFPLFIAHFGLFNFAVPRFRQRKTILPESFVFLATGLLSSFIGTLIELAVGMEFLSTDWSSLGRTLLLQCFILSLVIGVGSRLVPALLGWGMHPAVQTGLFKSNRHRRLLFMAFAILFPMSYLLEARSFTTSGQSLRLLITVFIALRFWRVSSLPKHRTKLACSLWLSTWAIPLGMLGSLIWPTYHIHFLHVIFVAGLGLMTFMVATRVVLAHGGYSLLLESSTGSLVAVGVLACLAALFRLSAGILPIHYFAQLDLAAICWLAMVILWWKDIGARTLPRFSLRRK